MEDSPGKRLKTFIRRHNMSYPDFAKKIDVARAVIWGVCEKDKLVVSRIAYKIEAYTGGEVKACELCKAVKK